LTEPAPAESLPYMRAIWHAGRGLAFSAQQKVKEAERELAALAQIKDDPALKTIGVSSVNVASSIAVIAYEVVAGEIAGRLKRAPDAVRHFERAAALERELTYMEPPDWPVPVRELQGAALLELGRAKEAEASFRADLVQWAENGWSLSGLVAALERQGRTADASEVKTRFERAWRLADTTLVAGRPRQPS
jgi:tetratricopeptide (TPR) repeat protein